jgi:hypothetical protein
LQLRYLEELGLLLFVEFPDQVVHHALFDDDPVVDAPYKLHYSTHFCPTPSFMAVSLLVMFGIITPGESTRNVNGCSLIFVPVKLFVVHGIGVC